MTQLGVWGPLFWRVLHTIAEQVGKEYGQAMATGLTGHDAAVGTRSLRSALQAVADALGLKNVKAFDNGSYPGMAIHEMGTARMGRDPKTSVLNGNNQVHACKNVFVTDGACMTSTSCVNPSLTYMALTARAADFAVKEIKKKHI